MPARHGQIGGGDRTPFEQLDGCSVEPNPKTLGTRSACFWAHPRDGRFARDPPLSQRAQSVRLAPPDSRKSGLFIGLPVKIHLGAIPAGMGLSMVHG